MAAADLLVHAGDDPARDLLEGEADVSFIGGFASAAAALGKSPELIMLDTTEPQRPRARPLAAALARIVRARAINPKFIAGQMRHGPRGAAELAETVDRLIAFADTTGAVSSALIDLVHDAYLGDPAVRDFLLRENPAAARAIAERLDHARRRGLWQPRRNDVDRELAEAMPRLRQSGKSTCSAAGPVPGSRRPCPPATDGWVRLTPKGPIDPAAFVALCALARQHGNGVMEVTSRGNLQVRGLTSISAPLFADDQPPLEIAAAEGIPVVSNSRWPVLTNPLCDDADATIDADNLAGESAQPRWCADRSAHQSRAEGLGGDRWRRPAASRCRIGRYPSAR